MTPSQIRTEVVRGRDLGPRADQILAFWASHDALTGDAAQRRLPEVICLLVDAGDEVVGTSSGFRDRVAHLGGRPFWSYRHFVDPALLPDGDELLLSATFHVLAGEAATDDGEERAPVGVCALVGDRNTLERRREAVWPTSGFLYAGYDDQGAQVRVRYFDGASIL